MTEDFQKELESLINKEYPDYHNLDITKKSEIFFDVYKELVRIMKKDFNYGLQIVEMK